MCLINIDHNLFQIIIRINELNIPALGPYFLVLNRILTSSQHTCRIRFQFIADSFDSISGSVVLVASLWDNRHNYMNVI